MHQGFLFIESLVGRLQLPPADKKWVNARLVDHHGSKVVNSNVQSGNVPALFGGPLLLEPVDHFHHKVVLAWQHAHLPHFPAPGDAHQWIRNTTDLNDPFPQGGFG